MRRRGVLVVAVIAAWLAFAPTVTASGRFTPERTYPATGGIVYGAGVADFTGDGLRDMVAARDANDIAFLPGRTHGRFNVGRMSILPDPREPEGIAIGNLNGDRLPDFVAADFTQGYAGTLTIFTGRKGHAPAQFGNPLPAWAGPWVPAIADLNHDGKPDLVVANYFGGGVNDAAVSVLLGQGGATFGSHVDYAGSPGDQIGLAVGDMNGDHIPDIVTLDDLGNVAVLLGNGDGTFAAPINTAAMGTDQPDYQMVIGDFDHDGKMDAVVTDVTADTVVFLPGTNDGHFGTPVPSATTGFPMGIAAADFNRDGKPDLAVGDLTSPYGANVLYGKGDGTFVLGPRLTGDTTTGSPEFLLATRIDGDRRPDVLVGADGGVTTWLNCRRTFPGC